MSENVFINIKNRSLSINGRRRNSAGRRERRDPRPGGPVRRLEHVPEGRQADLLLQLPRASGIQGLGTAGVAPGKATIRMNFDYDGGGVGKGGTATLLVNGKRSRAVGSNAPRGDLLGRRGGGSGSGDATPVTTDYKERDNGFTGKILKVTVDVKPIGAAVKAEADTGQHEAAVKQALSN